MYATSVHYTSSLHRSAFHEYTRAQKNILLSCTFMSRTSFVIISKVAIIRITMSDLQPENYPSASGEAFGFDPVEMTNIIEGRITNLSQFFQTEFGAFSLLQRVAEAQEKIGKTAQMNNIDGYWQQYPSIKCSPDSSNQPRFLKISFHTTEYGTRPCLAVRTNPEELPIEYYDRMELLVASAALKGYLLKNGRQSIIQTLMGPPSEEYETLINRQQRYARWSQVAAQAMGVSLVKRSWPLGVSNPGSLN